MKAEESVTATATTTDADVNVEEGKEMKATTTLE